MCIDLTLILFIWPYRAKRMPILLSSPRVLYHTLHDICYYVLIAQSVYWLRYRRRSGGRGFNSSEEQLFFLRRSVETESGAHLMGELSAYVKWPACKVDRLHPENTFTPLRACMVWTLLKNTNVFARTCKFISACRRFISLRILCFWVKNILLASSLSSNLGSILKLIYTLSACRWDGRFRLFCSGFGHFVFFFQATYNTRRCQKPKLYLRKKTDLFYKYHHTAGKMHNDWKFS
jgi:hypothetical protein